MGPVLTIAGGDVSAQSAAAPTVQAAPASPAAAGASAGGASANAPGAAPELDFVAALRELRSALHEVSTQRQRVKERGDKLKEACLYERQRAIAQALDSTEVAQVAWEAAVKQGEAGKTRAHDEQARAQKAVELVRELRSAAESCVGEELRGASRPTTVTISGPGKLDDPQAGPAEAAQDNVLRLELPARPNPASAFHPSR